MRVEADTWLQHLGIDSRAKVRETNLGEKGGGAILTSCSSGTTGTRSVIGGPAAASLALPATRCWSGQRLGG